jgi:hypothetical protein
MEKHQAEHSWWFRLHENVWVRPNISIRRMNPTITSLFRAVVAALGHCKSGADNMLCNIYKTDVVFIRQND